MEGPALERVVYLEDSGWGLMLVWKDADFGRGAGLGSGVCLEHAGPGGNAALGRDAGLWDAGLNDVALGGDSGGE